VAGHGAGTPAPIRTGLLARLLGIHLILGSSTSCSRLWNYLPATLFLFLAFVLQMRTGRKQPALFGASGVLITFVGAAVQRLGIALHPTYFNHNALYHVLQAVALVLLLAAFRRLIRDEEMDKARVTQATPDHLAGAAEDLEEQSAVERRRT
jgi:hypothetical protein